MCQSKRILIIALNYAPEQVGCAKYTTELAEDLVRRGHEVEVVCGPPYYPQWTIYEGHSGLRYQQEVLNGVTLHRVPLYVPRHPSGFRRMLHLGSFGLAAVIPAIRTARRLRPDLVFAVAPTLAAAGTAAIAARSCGAGSWLHIQDFEVDAAFGLGLLRGRLTRKFALWAERTLFSRFDRVTTISPTMAALLVGKGVSATRVSQLRNWVDITAIVPLPTGTGRYRRDLNVPPSHLVALYSGNMATKQGIEMLGDVCRLLEKAKSPVTVILCGEGPARAALEVSCAGLRNVRFLPLQPMARLNELLNTADMHLLPQRPEAADLVLPSKLTGMLASGRPVVAMAAAGSGLAFEVEGCGLVTYPSAEAMTAGVLSLADNPGARETFGLSARRRAEERWSKEAILDGLENEIYNQAYKREGNNPRE